MIGRSANNSEAKSVPPQVGVAPRARQEDNFLEAIGVMVGPNKHYIYMAVCQNLVPL
jgi:hypothetical protein